MLYEDKELIPMPEKLKEILMSDAWQNWGRWLFLVVFVGSIAAIIYLFWGPGLLIPISVIGGLSVVGLIITCIPYGICCPQNVLGDQVQGGPPQGNAAPRARLVDYDPARANV